MVHWWISGAGFQINTGDHGGYWQWKFEGIADRTVSHVYVIRTGRVLSPDGAWPERWLSGMIALRFELPSPHILHVRCQFCLVRTVGRNLQFLQVWVRLSEKSIVQRDGQAQERAQAKLEQNRRWLERKKLTFLVRSGNAHVKRRTHPMETSILRLTRAVQTTSLESTPQDVSGLAVGKGIHTRIFVGLRLCRDRSASVDTSFCSGPDSADIVKTSLLACS